MEFLVPLLIVVVVCAVVLVIFRAVNRKGGQRPARGQIEINRDMAVEAGQRLTPEQHRLIYSLIAQGQRIPAIKEYRQATRASLRDAFTAVTALEHFPQPTPSAQAAAPVEFTVDDILKAAPVIAAEPARASYRYRAIVSQGEEMREVVSTRLNEDIFQEIRTLALAKNYDGAARLLCDHADIERDAALEFVRMIEP